MELTTLDVREDPGFTVPSLETVKGFFPYEQLREYQGEALQKLIGAYRNGYDTDSVFSVVHAMETE